MAASNLPVRPSHPQTEYTGRFIETLFEMVEKTEKKVYPTDDDDDIMLELESRVGHLTIDEVLARANRRAS
jgi:hypothetical protein